MQDLTMAELFAILCRKMPLSIWNGQQLLPTCPRSSICETFWTDKFYQKSLKTQRYMTFGVCFKMRGKDCSNNKSID